MSDPYDYYEDDDYQICPRCNGDGEINCYCAGDFCICDNHGEAPCPLCHGEREVTDKIADKYLKREAEFMEVMRTALAKEPEE